MSEEMIVLFQSLIINWPIIWRMGFRIMLPVLISASSSIQKERITKSLSYDFVRYANISDNLDLEDKFSACSSVPVFLDVSSVDHQIRSNKMHERLEKIMGATDGYIGGQVCDFFPVLITVGKIPKYLKSRVMVVPLELNPPPRLIWPCLNT